MSTPKIGTSIVGVRQTCGGVFADKPPTYDPGAGPIDMEPDLYTEGLYQYADPDDLTKITADTGEAGEFDFGELPIAIEEIRAAIGANNYTAKVEDADASVSCTFLSAVSGDGTRQSFHPPVVVLPGERLRISSAGGSGSITIYCVKADTAG